MIDKWIIGKTKKGHFAVYTREGKRFLVPLCYLNHPIFRVLLEMAEEEFGTKSHGPLQIPCEEELMDFILSLVRKNNPCDDVQEALTSMDTCKGASVASFFPIFHAHNNQRQQHAV